MLAGQLKNTPFSGNVSSLLIIQLMNYVIPIAVLPILINKLGENNYGIFALAQYLSGLLMILCDYGFVYTGPKQISGIQGNRIEQREVFWTITWIKTGLLLISGLLVLLIGTFLMANPFEQEALYYSLLGLAGNMLTPLWFLQGMQRLKSLSVINVVFKIFQLILLVFAIDDTNDLGLACFFFFGTNFLLGLAAFFYTVIAFKLNLVLSKWTDIKFQMKQGLSLFSAVFFSSIYIHGTGVVLRVVSQDPSIVGIYSLGEKYLRAVTYMFNPLIQAFFPIVSKMFLVNKELALLIFFKFFKLFAILTSFVMLLVILSGDWLLNALFEKSFGESIWVVYLLSPLVVVGNLGNLLGYNLYLQMGWQRITVYIMIVMALISLVTAFMLSHWYGANGAAISLIITETVGFVLLYGYYLKQVHKR